MTLDHRSIPLPEANAFVARHHRHHKPVVGHKFSIGAYKGDLPGGEVARRSGEGKGAVAGEGGVKPLALDLFCGAGGVSMGLHRAGFKVIGVDIRPQPRYPFTFVQADALRPPFRLSDFDFIWASPPCQAHTALKTMYNAKHHEDLIPETREMLIAAGVPYAIENVPGSPLRADIILCGTMFNLGTGDAELRRHRLFETNLPLILVPPCNHYARGRVCGVYGGHGRDRRRIKLATVGVYGKSGGHSSRNGTQQFSTAERREAMGIDWMSGEELSQAIPPAYAEYIGREAMRGLV